jgi:hypothetical protein
MHLHTDGRGSARLLQKSCPRLAAFRAPTTGRPYLAEATGMLCATLEICQSRRARHLSCCMPRHMQPRPAAKSMLRKILSTARAAPSRLCHGRARVGCRWEPVERRRRIRGSSYCSWLVRPTHEVAVASTTTSCKPSLLPLWTLPLTHERVLARSLEFLIELFVRSVDTSITFGLWLPLSWAPACRARFALHGCHPFISVPDSTG